MTRAARGVPRTFDLDMLRAFVAVAERGSFVRAGVALHLSASGVSMRVRRLEAREGLRLFERVRNGLALTRHGEALLPYARRLLALNDEARAALGPAPGRESVVRLGAMEDYGHRVLPGLLAEHAALAPRTIVEVETGTTGPMLPRLGDRVDLLLATHAAGSAAGGVPLGVERPVWAAAPGFALAEGEPLPLALYADGCLFRRWGLEALGRDGIPWRMAYASASQAMVEAAVVSGLGCAPARASILPPGLRPVESLPAMPDAEVRLHVARDASRAARDFAAFLCERLRARRSTGEEHGPSWMRIAGTTTN